jgi:predicted acyl esterase
MKRSLYLPVALFAAASSLSAQAPPDTSWLKREEMVPMRDGVRLKTFIVAQRSPAARQPILLVRTPYGAAGPAGFFPGRTDSWLPTATCSRSRTSVDAAAPRANT